MYGEVNTVYTGLPGCALQWLDRWPESANGSRPFFGVYYQELDPHTVQMANAVDLAALYAEAGHWPDK